ncbi:hypothetical protein QB607_002835 [Clostridium botulinum]|nr:hypothetical protein [Clostridium botulinum]EKS4395312.1 hypothetical protein [Clostridium botulinum]
MDNNILKEIEDYKELINKGIESLSTIMDKCDDLTKFAPSIKYALNIIDYARLKLFLKGISAGRYNGEQLRDKINHFGDKEKLLNIIKKQYESEHKFANVLCGIIIHECLENGKISSIDLNHIEFLLTLNDNDFKNYISTYYNCDEHNIYKISDKKELILLETTREKMRNYGYCSTGKLADMGGDIVHTELSKKLMKYLEKHDQFIEEIISNTD